MLLYMENASINYILYNIIIYYFLYLLLIISLIILQRETSPKGFLRIERLNS